MSRRPRIVRVELGQRGYDIEIGQGTLGRLGEFVAARRRVTHAVLVTDEHVDQPPARQAAASLSSGDCRVDVIVLPPGETTKSPAHAVGLWQGLLELGADRQ